MQTGSHQSCKMMQSSIEDGEDGEDSNDAETNKENTEPCMEKAAAPTRKRKRKLIPKVHTQFIMQNGQCSFALAIVSTKLNSYKHTPCPFNYYHCACMNTTMVFERYCLGGCVRTCTVCKHLFCGDMAGLLMCACTYHKHLQANMC